MDVHLNTLTDEQLLSKYSKTLEAEIIDILFERYMHLVYAVSLKYLKHPQIAEDSVMDVFEIVMAKGIKSEIENFKSWLHVVTKNHCFKLIKKYQMVFLEDGNLLSYTNYCEPEKLEEERMDNNPLVRLMKKYLEKLTQEQRICIELFYFHGLDYKKIVFKTGFSFSLVKSAIQNGKRKLRLLLENTPGFNYEHVRIVFR